MKVDPDGVLEDDGNAWDTEVEAKDDSAPHILPGRYDAIVVKGHVHKYRWSDAKVSSRFVLTFEVINHQLAGTRLEFVCELPKKVGSKSKFMRAWEVANGGPAKRRDRLKLNVFRSRMFVVEVGDVERDRRQVALPRPYSVVRAIVDRIA